MPWTRRKFTIASEDGAGKTVSGWTSNGLGVHRFPASKRDSLGRQRWAVSHLNTGLFILYVNAKDAETATRIADLIVNEVDWTGMTSPDEFAEKDPEWIARLLGIKHTLGGDSIEFLNPAMNDPANIVMMDRKMTKQ